MVERPPGGPANTYHHELPIGAWPSSTNTGTYFDSTNWCSLPQRWIGLLHVVGACNVNSCEDVGTVKDGTSNTFAVGEYSSQEASTYGVFWGDSTGPASLGTIFIENRTMIPDYGATGTVGTCAGTAGTDGANPCQRAFASMHPNGMNFVAVDDAVHLVSTTINVNLYFALGTIANADAKTNAV